MREMALPIKLYSCNLEAQSDVKPQKMKIYS